MSVIDRHLLRQFLQTFVICFASLMGLFVVIDGFGNLEEFIEHAKGHGGLLSVMGQYYSYRTLAFFDLTCGILMLVAAMFTLVWLEKHNELTALLAAGISKARIAKPLLAAVIGICLLATVNREFFLPAARGRLSRNAQDLSGTRPKPVQPCRDGQTDVLLRGQECYAGELRIHKPNFILPAELQQRGRNAITADDAFYFQPQGKRPGGYLFRGAVSPADLENSGGLSGAGGPVVLSPRDAPWLKPGELFVVSNIAFEQLQGGAAWRDYASARELIRGLNAGGSGFGADVRVAVHRRFVQPLLDFTLFFLGMPLAFSGRKRNVFWAIGLSMALTVAFMIVVLGCQKLGMEAQLTPALAAWLPLVIFVPAAVSLADPLWE